jgi:penicillin-binding protein 1A
MPPFRRLLRWGLIAFAAASLLGLLALGIVYSVVSSRLPDVQSLRHVELQEPLYVQARDGRLMAVFGEARRHPVDIARVPERVKEAFIAIEDARFYQHHGVDYKGVARAIWLLATTSDKRVPGGSTITQQVAKQFYLTSEYSFTRKFVEMMLAMKMERELGKDEIFQLYLNKSFFGNRAYGIGAAAEFYYGKQVDELSLDEAASLAAIPKFPSSGNPVSNPERARIRRNYVLQRMRELGFITRADEAAAQAVPMHAAPHDIPIEADAPYVAEMVRREMIARYGEDVLTRGYRVTTTIDPALQEAAQQAVRDGLVTYDHRRGWRKTPERHFDLAPGESAEDASARLRGVAVQGGLLPAIVLRSGDGSAEVALGDGSVATLDAASSRWTGRTPAALVQRGDLVRVRKVVDPKAEPGTPGHWQLDQLPQAQAALVSLDRDNGALLALVGGFSFAANKFNRATQARRQPGSSFKPFLYAAAMERGFNPASIVLDAPVVFKDRVGHEWRPQNDTGDFAGPMRLREALVQSRNLVSVRLLDAIGIDYARRYISHFGIDEAMLPPNQSMSLGSASLPPMMIARGYATFPNGGFRVTPWFIDEVRDRDGRLLFKEKPATACPGCGVANANATTVHASNVVAGFDLGPGATAAPAARETSGGKAPAAPAPLRPDTVLAPRAIDARVAYQLVSMMRDVVQRGTGVAAKVLGREDVAGKTGSTNDHRDAWFSGFGADVVTTVWVGRDDFKSLGYREYGGKAALPIWIQYMRVALEGRPIAANDPPEGMVKVAVGPGGRLLPAGSPGIVEWVKAEDLDRMESDSQAQPDETAEDEAAFDIF